MSQDMRCVYNGAAALYGSNSECHTRGGACKKAASSDPKAEVEEKRGVASCTLTEKANLQSRDTAAGGGGRAYPLHIIYASEPLGSKRFNPCARAAR